MERAVLVGTPRSRGAITESAEHMSELSRLTDTAGGVVVGQVVQRLRVPNPRYFLGEGKARELAETVKEMDADLVIFDDELTPGQGHNLEKLLGVRVMDRSELILDIFATRARTYEARLQVELAMLQYLLPRLARMWSHLSRIRGGIGLRGPGETQLETDRRLIGTRIADLRQKLKGVARARATQRKHRERYFRAVLVGYTNAGKSALLQALSGSEQFVEDRLFATLDSSTRLVSLDGGHEALVTDTVGFIRKLPHHLVASFRSTLEETREADVLLHVIDVSSPGVQQRRSAVRSVLTELGLEEKPRLMVFHKIDLLEPDDLLALKSRTLRQETDKVIFTSARQPATLVPLREALAERIRSGLTKVSVALPAGDGKTLAVLYREAEVLTRSQDGATLRVVARVPPALLTRLGAAPDVRIGEAS